MVQVTHEPPMGNLVRLPNDFMRANIDLRV